MVFLIFSFVAVAIPYGLERFYFASRFGFFAAILWLFVFQASVLFGAEIILEDHLGQSLPGWIKSIGFAVEAVAYLTIGLTPFAAVVAALGFATVIAANRFSRKPGES
ncbi:hypothetical protein EN836_28160 [Mesorhizobium sp. M1C.F.Ca.ET.193.01.1.1]|uniref:hypothetical protein n=1 Tax=unclassified Mesorhizobium TaxID=325217 RepID=UPI000FD528CE|nr:MULTISPECIES: hypothetical protein [unclassified Mesorhizobium]TGS93338.1 hypothetical protein EN820_48820 [bacterium M00.F.Ca.ET.177.01.1.1]TGQ50615.1 hypothetical protein EN853_28150 [Mesorhizobium sp. M1C.F.Ca.ET.210.01.1.1]TGQ65786.1 hypothetical protein EN855_028165 [Mesorhizobium sp. M1C.F.Ca.ET.212.01.1.1]TGQ99731.1 hypothetical protein EN847_28150 [Mesorhizobium sp. M1C.F.Ca.ET.204.01.1.1]TGR20147.1 hypothetical protein EN839_28150 [Mesorhizobium sp. M1C.F.Ca.ET.196.01.1.1]